MKISSGGEEVNLERKVDVIEDLEGKYYLYDIIKKKRASFSSLKTLLSKKPISCVVL